MPILPYVLVVLTLSLRPQFVLAIVLAIFLAMTIAMTEFHRSIRERRPTVSPVPLRRHVLAAKSPRRAKQDKKLVARSGSGGVATFADRKEKKSGRWPLILWGLFAMACVVALILVGDLARYQEAGLVSESQAALRDVNDPAQLDRALKQYPANRILKLVALANEKSAEIDA